MTTEITTPDLAKRRISVQEAIQKANTLIEAMGWIRKFRGKTTVIKLGGSLLEDEESRRHILLDIIFMESVGMKPVVVHGGGKAINHALELAGIEAKFIRGRRVTDDATLKIVEQVLAGDLNRQLTSEIESLGGRAINLSFETTNVLRRSLSLASGSTPRRRAPRRSIRGSRWRCGAHRESAYPGGDR